MERIVVGITGASGTIYGHRLLMALQGRYEIHLVVTESARKVAEVELGMDVAELEELADYSYDNEDLGSSPASGSFLTKGMVIAPCSIKTLSAVANSYNDTLIARTADVMLKERRRLVLAVRETPFHLGHLNLMADVTRMGGIIAPPIPAFYHRPTTIDELVDHSVGKILDLLGVEHTVFKRWEGQRRT